MPLLFLSALGALAGERIRFTDEPTHSERATPPKPGLKEDFSRPFDLDPDAVSRQAVPDMPTPPVKQNTRDPKLEELIDQKKNWIFSTPSRFDRDAALKQIFKIREYKFNNNEGRPKSSWDRYIEKEGEAKDSAKPNSGEDEAASGRTSEKKELSGSNSTLPLEKENRSSTAPDSDLNVNSLLTRMSNRTGALALTPSELMPRTLDSFGAPGSGEFSGYTRAGSSLGSGQLSPQEQRLQEFQRMFAPAKGSAATADPINAQRDATRQAINPVLGTTPETGLNSGLSEVGVSGFGGPPSRGGLSDLLGSRISSGSSLAPSFSAPAISVPIMQARPPTLEIPRRKF